MTAAAASPSRRRARHHREPDPVSGMTPEARLSVPAGTPGKPGVPCSATSVPSSVVKPAPDNAETGVLEGVAQDGGTDIGPIEPARPALASTASCMLAAAPFSAELSAASIPNAPGANSAGFSLAAPKRPKLFSAPMMPAHIDSMSCVTPTVAYAANMPSRMVKSSGRMLGHPVGASTACDRKRTVATMRSACSRRSWWRPG